MPVPFTAAQIKAWFETADVPTQQQFADFVDTMFHMVQQANDTADAAVALAELASQCFGLVTFTYNHSSGSTLNLTVNRVQDCAFAASAVFSTVGSYRKVAATLTITPTANFTDTNYAALLSFEGVAGDNESPPTLTRNVGSLVIYKEFLFQATVLAGTQTRKLSFDIKP